MPIDLDSAKYDFVVAENQGGDIIHSQKKKDAGKRRPSVGLMRQVCPRESSICEGQMFTDKEAKFIEQFRRIISFDGSCYIGYI